MVRGGGDESIFTIAGPVTDLTLVLAGGSTGGRGPSFIEVTAQASDPEAVPTMSMVGMILLAGLLGLLAMRSQRQATPAG